MNSTFNQSALELHRPRLGPLWPTWTVCPSVVVAAAGAVGLTALGPPVVREGPRGISVGMLCQNGHVVLHAMPEEGICLVDVVAREPADASRGAR